MHAAPVVILTREHEDNLPLMDRLAALGIEILEYPCIASRIIPYAGGQLAGRDLEDFKVIAFASKRGVAGMRLVADRLKYSGALLAAVGETTASAINDLLGRKADLIAEPQTGEGLARAIIGRLPSSAPVLYVQGNKGTGEFKKLLEANNFEVCDLVVYENYFPEMVPLEINQQAIAVFASPSAAEAFFETNMHLKDVVQSMAIGPTTEQALKSMGVKDIAVAPKPAVEPLAETIRMLIKSGG